MPAIEDYERMCTLPNLLRAYRWIQSNPDPLYKNLFRDAYDSYALASQYNLRRLRRLLAKKAYEAEHASKIYLPKPSGVLRPYTLLSVNDQIVYQACINVVADKLKPHVKKRYENSTFGHLYAGKTSKFFYKQWQKGYRAYSQHIVKFVADGYNFVANFDLASFYDSIDHNVLKYFLLEINVDADLVEFLLKCLKTWSSCTWSSQSRAIYHEHGIPQGPLSSGLLSEVVLKYLDERSPQGRSAKYVRYVDDIKIFAKTERLLRRKLISLDLAAKEVGLFPQSTKINIRKVINPYDEIRSISIPPEPAVKMPKNQQRLSKRLLELSRRGRVEDKDRTRFKYLLAIVSPTAKLNLRLLKVLEHQPQYSTQIASYFSRYKMLPSKAVAGILDYLGQQEIYHSVLADVLFAVLDNMGEPYRSQCAESCYKRLTTHSKELIEPQPFYKAALIAWVLRHRKVNFSEFTYIIQNEIDWWVIKSALAFLQAGDFGQASFEQILNDAIKHRSADVARMAAGKLVIADAQLRITQDQINEAAKPILFVGNKIRHIGKPESLMTRVIPYILGQNLPAYNWERLLQGNHKQGEQIALAVKGYFESNITAFIVTLDSLCDLIFEAIFCRKVPGASYGNYGSMLKHPTLNSMQPKTCAGFQLLHQLRLQSNIAHPRDIKSGGPTRRLKHPDWHKVRPQIIDAFKELVSTPL